MLNTTATIGRVRNDSAFPQISRLLGKPEESCGLPSLLLIAFILCALFLSAVFLSALFLSATLLSAPAEAEYISPASVQVKTERYLPEQSDFPLGTYRYDVNWQGIPVASARVEVAGEGGDAPIEAYKVQASAKTGGMVKLFYKMKHLSQSVFDADSLEPRRFISKQEERSRKKTRKVSFSDNGIIRAQSEKNGRPGRTLEFNSGNATFDPISAAFLARSLPLELGKVASFDVFNGKHRYLITFTVAARETIEVLGRSLDTFKVIPHVEKLTDSEGEKRLSSASIWITADARRDVVKLESEVFVGSVEAELKDFTPAPSGISVAAVAQ